MAPSSSDDPHNGTILSPADQTTVSPTTPKRHRCTTSSQSQQQTLTQPSPPNLPIDIIVEILRRLPVKILWQLRCVCKSWKSLISDPQFAKKHLRHSPTVSNLLLCFSNPQRDFTLQAFPLPSVLDAVTLNATPLRYPLNLHKSFHLVAGSCDGILCFAVDHNTALLWNPTIGEFKELPSLDNQGRESGYTIYGFGYDVSADRYKVVSVFCYECDTSVGAGVYKTQVKVFTLGTDSWRTIQEFPSGVPFDSSGKFVCGTLNWLASTASSSSWVIVSLDLGNESYQELLQPDYGGVAVVTLTLGVLRDCLCLLSHCDVSSDIWLMKDYGNKDSWTKLFSVPYMGNPDSFPYTKALCMSEDDQVLLECRSQLVVYTPRNGTFKVPEFQNISSWKVPEIYVESLISPCSQC